jgi:GntR family transcriptional repressor for pyruvate dehydrogenase complex
LGTPWQELFHPLQPEDGALSFRAAKQIERLVASGQLKEGDRLPPERDLAEYLGVSRTVVREAIKLLKATGIVRAHVGVGTFVAKPSLDILGAPLSFFVGGDSKSVEDLHQVREILEPAIAALAAQNATMDNVKALERAMDEMTESVSNPGRYVLADHTFHSTLAEATQNSVLQLLLHSVVELMHEARWLSLQSPGAAERANRFHRAVLEAVKRGDSAAARQEMVEHLAQARAEILTGMKRTYLPGDKGPGEALRDGKGPSPVPLT